MYRLSKAVLNSRFRIPDSGFHRQKVYHVPLSLQWRPSVVSVRVDCPHSYISPNVGHKGRNQDSIGEEMIDIVEASLSMILLVSSVIYTCSILSSPTLTAVCSGVSFLSSWAWTSAPLLRSISTIPSCFPRIALCKGVRPNSSVTPISAMKGTNAQ